jgi:hypothetical protein
MLVRGVVKLSEFGVAVVIKEGQPDIPAFLFFEFPLEPQLKGFVEGSPRFGFPLEIRRGIAP